MDVYRYRKGGKVLMDNNSIIITKEVLSNEVVSVDYYTINGTKYGDKRVMLEVLAKFGIELNLTTLNLILGNHMVPKSVTSKYPNLKFIDNVDNIPTRYFYK